MPRESVNVRPVLVGSWPTSRYGTVPSRILWWTVDSGLVRGPTEPTEPAYKCFVFSKAILYGGVEFHGH
jgi:hypothetical protein